MITGTYQVSMKLNGTEQRGTLVLKEDDGRLSGTLKTRDVTSSFSGGRVNGSRFSFSGAIQKFIMTIRYTANGMLDGDDLTIGVQTKYGTFTITGMRIPSLISPVV